MMKISTPIIAFAVALIAFGAAGADYFVAADGDDANDGRSQERPVETLLRADRLEAKPGDRILFRRGDLFRGSMTARKGVTYGAYGEGNALPTICGSKRDYADPKLWVKTAEPNVWQCTEELKDVGIILFDRDPKQVGGEGRTAEMRLPERHEPYNKPVVLDADLTFRNLFAKRRLELRSDSGNPGERFRHIEIGAYEHCLTVKTDDVTVENIHFTLAGGHGISGTGDRRNMEVRDCEFGWIGGSILLGWKWGTVRFGNAIEIWGGCNGFRALRNRISDIYDTGVTIQCNDSSNFVCKIENVLFASNVIDNCFWALEYYNRNNAPGSYTRNMRFVGNVCRGTGRGWGCKGREKRAPAVSIGETPEGSSNMVIEGNQFLGSTGTLVMFREPIAKGAVRFRGNTYEQSIGGTLILRAGPVRSFSMAVNQRSQREFLCDGQALDTIRRELGDETARVRTTTDK